MTDADPRKRTAIDPSRDIVTLINIFELEPENQQTFIETQTAEYKRLSGQLAGALAANLHRGLGGTRAVNYAQFATLDQLQEWQRGNLMKGHMPAIRALIAAVNPGVYRLTDLVARDGYVAHIRESELALIAVQTCEPNALSELLDAQRVAAGQLLHEVPGVRALALHERIEVARPPGAPARPDLALYAQVESVEAAAALQAHPQFCQAFTTENHRIRSSQAEVYAVEYVQNEAATP